MSSSQPGLLFRSSITGTDGITDLVGRTFFSLASGESEVLAMCHDGVHGVGANETIALSELPLAQASAGRGFYVGIDSENKLYSWGNIGHTGQLGHGACHQFLEVPSRINHASEFVQVSCGQSFTLALDSKGGAHAWGENFERQLGLYTKTKAQMHLQNAMVEDLSFVPRLIPLSASHPIVKVACGQKFALVITKGGICYSWGAGECGQLGTGRCTMRDVPAPVLLRAHHQDASAQPDTPLLVRDVACGAGHVIAVSQDGELYSWGLNKSQQLGNGSTSTEHFPVKVALVQQQLPDPAMPSDQPNDATDNTVFSKVFAHTHSSAAITHAGKLYTWGSALNDRLMHVLPLQPVAEPVTKILSYRELRTQRMACAPGHVGHIPASRVEAKEQRAAVLAARRLPVSTVARPTLVRTEHLVDCAVHDFAFAASHSAALVLTCLKKAWPSEGPRRSFSKLQLLGDGFWDAPNIIVKFTFKQAHMSATHSVSHSKTSAARPALPGDPGFNPPRSCSGRCVDSGTIECKPPKFSQPGVYTVSLSMDGVYFLQNNVEIFVHQELVVQKQLPELLDLSASATVDHLELHVLGLSSMPGNWQGTYTVRLAFTNLEKDPGNNGSYNNTARTVSTKNSSTSRRYPQQGASTTNLQREEPAVPDFTVTTVATLVPPTTRASTPVTVQSQDTDNEEEPGEEKKAHVEEEPSAAVLLCTGLDLSDFQATAGRALYEMRCQVSLNGQDFSSVKVANSHSRLHHQRSSHHSNPDAGIHTEHNHEANAGNAPAVAAPPSTLVYAFTPDAVQPSCLSLARFVTAQHVEGDTLSLAVRGRSFLPNSRLPKGARVVATLSPCLGDIVWAAGFASQLTAECSGDLQELAQVHYDVRCDSSSGLTVTIDAEAAAQLQRLVTAINCLASGLNIPSETSEVPFQAVDEGSVKEAVHPPTVPQRISVLPIQLDFAMILSTGQLLPLTSYSADCPPLCLTLYQDQPLQIVPSLARSADTAVRPYSLLVNRPVQAEDLAAGVPAGSATVGDGFDFQSDNLVVAVYVPMPGVGGDVSSGTINPATDFYSPLLLPPTDIRLCPVLAAPLLAEDEGSQAMDTQVMPVPSKYLLQFVLPSLSDLVATVSSSGAGGVPSFVYVTCWLDGHSVPAMINWSKLLYVGDLIAGGTLNPAAPKTGFLPGNALTLDLTTFCPAVPVMHPTLLQLPSGALETSPAEAVREVVEVDADGVVTARTDLSSLMNEPMALAPQPQQYAVRIRGAPTAESPGGASVTVQGRLANPVGTTQTTSISFEIPNSIKSTHDLVPVQKTPKDKPMYFVDVSIDSGLSFDSAEQPLLFLK